MSCSRYCVDNIMNIYNNNKKQILNLMLEDPDILITKLWGADGLLEIDNNCKCKMGSGDIRSIFTCGQCQNIKMLTDFRLAKNENSFKMSCPSFFSDGKLVIIGSSVITRPQIYIDNSIHEHLDVFQKKFPYFKLCKSNLQNTDIKYIACDSFTLRTLMLFMIEYIFNQKGMPHCPILYSAFVCNNTGYSIYEDLTIGSIEKLHLVTKYNNDAGDFSVETVSAIIIQLLVSLKELEKYNFCHGTPSRYSLVFQDRPVTYLYENVPIVSPFTLQISDLWYSSATFNNTHYYTANIVTDINIARSNFKPNIKVLYSDEGYVTFFIIDISSKELYNTIRHIGFPLYSCSLDFYCFIVSLMCDVKFYRTLYQNENLYLLWSSMWLSSEISLVEQRIRESQNLPHTNLLITNIINNIHLRCDIINHLWSKF